MLCPHCKKELELKPYVEYNVESYGNPVLAKAQCCGKPLYIQPIRSYRAQLATTERDTDDWGDPFTK